MTSTKTRNPRKTAAVALGIVGVAGLTLASAAQLNLSTGSLGAGTTVIASCQGEEPIDVGFESTFAPGADAEYKASNLNLSSIAPACNGQNYKVTLTDDGGAVIGQEATGTVSGTSLSVPLQDVSVEDVANVAVTIHS